MYFAFPSGRPGAGLVLLRIVTATAASATASRLPPDVQEWGVGTAAILAAMLAAGWLTRWTSLATLLCGLITAIIGPDATRLLATLSAGAAASLMLLGPGAYAADARLSGRRVISPPG